mmetsp:Transcript_24012/g.59553  ORF Transcript_24012/g.59553 Transcript_24012/m.59553 type:complete len:218 (-) Transcript_24012:683-1336(-)
MTILEAAAEGAMIVSLVVNAAACVLEAMPTVVSTVAAAAAATITVAVTRQETSTNHGSSSSDALTMTWISMNGEAVGAEIGGRVRRLRNLGAKMPLTTTGETGEIAGTTLTGQAAPKGVGAAVAAATGPHRADTTPADPETTSAAADTGAVGTAAAEAAAEAATSLQLLASKPLTLPPYRAPARRAASSVKAAPRCARYRSAPAPTLTFGVRSGRWR